LQAVHQDAEKAKIVGRLEEGVTGTGSHPENKRDATTHIDAKKSLIFNLPTIFTFPAVP